MGFDDRMQGHGANQRYVEEEHYFLRIYNLFGSLLQPSSRLILQEKSWLSYSEASTTDMSRLDKFTKTIILSDLYVILQSVLGSN